MTTTTTTYRRSRTTMGNAEEALAAVASELGSAADTVVVAGHYMLMYDDREDHLVPMVYQDSSNPRVSTFSERMAGDFPLRTFKHGLGLSAGLRAAGKRARIALLVNDHVFQTPPWNAQQNLADPSRGPELRHEYFRLRQPVPASYLRVLSEAGASLGLAVLDNHRPTRSRMDTVPKISWLFSEQTLRGKFQKETAPSLGGLSGFALRRQQGVAELHFASSDGGELTCLTDGHGCGCSGEIVQFLMTLASRGSDSVVIYLPHECSEVAAAGFAAFLHLPREMRHALKQVVVLEGFGGAASHSIDSPTVSITNHTLT